MARIPSRSFRPGAPLRRWAALTLLLLIAVFLGGMAHDHCDEGVRGHADRAPHLLCVDDCAPVVIPAAPAAPAADPLPRTRYEAAAAPQVLDRSLEPETAPPRA